MYVNMMALSFECKLAKSLDVFSFRERSERVYLLVSLRV